MPPHEQAILRKWIASQEMLNQLPRDSSDADIATITLTPVALRFLVGDMNHAIVKRGRSDLDAFSFSERLDYVLATEGGSLETG